MRIGRLIRGTLLIIALVIIALLVAWQLPGCEIDPQVLDYVRAYDDPATRSVIVVASFDAMSFGVIDSCTYQWNGGGLELEMRAKWIVARDGRSIRIGAFRVPYPPAVAGPSTAGATPFSPASVMVRGGRSLNRKPGVIEPMRVGFNPLVPIVDAELRK